jgi:Sap, sulfolipid-1-addressing protein
VLLQAAGFAVLAALSPTALLITAIYLGSARPRTTALAYLGGAVLMSTVTGIVILLALRAGHLQYRNHQTPRYGLRLGLGLLTLAVGAVLMRRKPRPPDPSRPGGRILSRLVSSPAPLTALAVGVLVFVPALTFIAAIQVIATARAGLPLSAVGLTVVVIINAAFVWLPFLAYLAAPELTSRKLTAFNAWLLAHGRTLLVLALMVGGAVLAANGILGLVRGS